MAISARVLTVWLAAAAIARHAYAATVVTVSADAQLQMHGDQSETSKPPRSMVRAEAAATVAKAMTASSLLETGSGVLRKLVGRVKGLTVHKKRGEDPIAKECLEEEEEGENEELNKRRRKKLKKKSRATFLWKINSILSFCCIFIGFCGFLSISERRARRAERETATKLTRECMERDRKLDYVHSRALLINHGSYSPSELSQWSTVLHLTGSVWARKSFKHVVQRMIALTLFVAVFVNFSFHWIKTDKNVETATTISGIFNGAVALLIGLFISNSLSRWFSCAEAFLELVDMIRYLQVHLSVIDLDEQKVAQVMRYSVVSAWLLRMELHVGSMGSGKLEEMESMWNDFVTNEGRDLTFGYLTEGEKTDLASTANPASTIMMWIYAIIRDLGMDSGDYWSATALVNGMQNAMRRVRSAIGIQPPYIYIQALSTLVHINNIINAFFFGILLGTDVFQLFWENYKHLQNCGTMKHQDPMMRCVVVCFGSFVGPAVFHALLEVSIAISRPFSSPDGKIPVRRLLEGLEHDLHDAAWIKSKLKMTKANLEPEDGAATTSTSEGLTKIGQTVTEGAEAITR